MLLLLLLLLLWLLFRVHGTIKQQRQRRFLAAPAQLQRPSHMLRTEAHLQQTPALQPRRRPGLRCWHWSHRPVHGCSCSGCSFNVLKLDEAETLQRVTEKAVAGEGCMRRHLAHAGPLAGVHDDEGISHVTK